MGKSSSSFKVLLLFLGCLVCVLFPCASCSSVSVGVPPGFPGVRRRDLSLYSGNTFRCRDGSQILPISHVNDDFCDCSDGSDEPSTSACSSISSTFFCKNVGARSTNIFSSRVNDGICDCCDGSDEWAQIGRQKPCPNTCAEQGRKENEERIETLSRMENGVRIRQSLLAESNKKFEEFKAKKEKYSKVAKERTAVVEELKEKLDKEEALEREENDRLKKIKEEQEAAAAAAAANAPPPSGQEGQPAPVDGVNSESSTIPPASHSAPPSPPTSPQEIIPHETAPPRVLTGIDEDEDDSEDDAEHSPHDIAERERRRGSRFSRRGRKAKKNIPSPPSAPPTAPSPTQTPETTVEEEVSAFPYPAEYAYVAGGGQNTATGNGDVEDNELESKEDPQFDSGDDDDEDDDEDYAETSNVAAAESRNGEYVSEAARQARVAYESAEKKRSRIQGKLDEVDRLLNNDFGPASQFYSLYKSCYSLLVKQYTYEMCPYESAKQKEGHSSTSLGNWQGFSVKEESGGTKQYVFSFTGGQTCWQGPQRSLEVQLTCGETNTVVSVEEPSKCVYLMKFYTPVVCDQEEVDQRKKKLQELMSSGEDDE